MRIRKLHTVKAKLKFTRSRRVPASKVARERHEEFIRVLEEGRLDEVVAESVRKSVAFNEQAYAMAKPISRSVELTVADETK